MASPDSVPFKYTATRVAVNTALGEQTIIDADMVVAELTPKAAMFTVTYATTDGTPIANAVFGMGLATATDEQSCSCFRSEDNQGTTDTSRLGNTDSCVVILNPADGSVWGEATFKRFVPGGVVIEWTTAPAAAVLLTVELFAGYNLDAKAIVITLGNQNVTINYNELDWEPDMLYVVCHGNTLDDTSQNGAYYSHGCVTHKNGTIVQNSWLVHSEDNVGTSNVAAYISDAYACGQIANGGGALIWMGEFSAFDAQGFSCTARLGNSGDDVAILALKFSGYVDYWTDIIDLPAGVGNDDQSGPGFTPQAVHCGLTNLAALNTLTTTGDAGTIGVNCFDEDDEYCNSIQDEDNQGTTDTQSLSDNQAINLPLDTGAAGFAATFVSFLSTGWRLNFTATPGAAKSWGSAIEEWEEPAQQTPAVIYHTGRQPTTLPLIVYDPLADDTLNVIDDELGFNADGVSALWTSFGGYWSLSFMLTGTQSMVESWIEEGLGRHVELYSPSLRKIWDGFVSTVSGNIGSLSITRGPLLDTVANKIKVQFSYVDNSTDPPSTGDRDETDWGENADSQAKYNIIERIISVSGTTLDNAEIIRDLALLEYAEPQTNEEDNLSGSAVPSVTITCLGYFHWFGAYTLALTTTGEQDVDAKILAIIAADPNGIFSTSTLEIVSNTTQVGAYDNDGRTALDALKALASLGDSAGNRYTLGMFNDRRIRYKLAPSTPLYQRSLSDPAQPLETYVAGGLVYPWEAIPGEWVFYNDFLIGHTPPSAFREDPRYLFIEQVRYDTPWSLTLTGAQISRLDQLLNMLGLGGRAA